ncbi:GlxA family transcriptional regulator [Sandaracinus amylolyticus]|uniref:GlxA family transcriptional regulator n=1 Tax=Sandaracinus amylolyticus TaxID=927083 RepID=UPI001F1DE7FA|nr:helix-turn-helix domain-containing protein [Sandaracinus amylolyticus]
MQIAVLALEGTFDVGLASLLDTLTTASDLARARGADAPRFEPKLVGVRRRVTTHQGLRVPVSPPPRTAPDVVVVPGLGCTVPDAMRERLERRDVAEAVALIRRWSAQGTKVSAACTGTFVLARSGLLDGHRATTTWWMAPLFRELFPRVELDESQMVVDSRGRVTAGAAFAHVDLALWWIRRKSPTLAAQAARYLVVDARPSQAPFVIPDQLTHEDPLVERFEVWARRRLADRFSLAAAARAVATSERTLSRRVRAVLGRTPLGYVQDLRVERAVHLMKTTSHDVEAIAREVGYSDGVTLRTLLRRRLGRGVRELRAR